MNWKLAHQYAELHTSEHSEILDKIENYTKTQVGQVNMLSGKLQGRLLSLISHLKRPKYILEIGTFTGYATICLAEGLSEDGEVYTLEKNTELETFHSEIFKKKPITVIYGDALETLKTLDKPWDLVFIDAAKREYLHFFELLEHNLPTESIIIADNVLWKGKVFQENHDDKRATALDDFSKKMLKHPEYSQVFLPLRDGLLLLQKIKSHV